MEADRGCPQAVPSQLSPGSGGHRPSDDRAASQGRAWLSLGVQSASRKNNPKKLKKIEEKFLKSLTPHPASFHSAKCCFPQLALARGGNIPWNTCLLFHPPVLWHGDYSRARLEKLPLEMLLAGPSSAGCFWEQPELLVSSFCGVAAGQGVSQTLPDSVSGRCQLVTRRAGPQLLLLLLPGPASPGMCRL